IILDDRTFAFSRGSVVCVPPGLHYAERSRHGFISLYIAIDGLGLTTLEHVHLGDDPRFALAARLVLEEWRRKDRIWPDAGMEALSVLVRCLRRHREAPSHGPLVSAALELVDMHAGDPGFTIPRAAARLKTTVRRMRRAFSAELKMSPLQYLTARRVDDAKRLFACGGFSVSDVAARVGFTDAYYFSRTFRRITGVSPLAYRRARTRG
ncbi:MAG: helix-turn-helix transcriptional regulator, partial [Planctomycetes bacterium]|nr:helix-turn-helix transcriptional regulator [Planctomycetota bacterium]